MNDNVSVVLVIHQMPVNASNLILSKLAWSYSDERTGRLRSYRHAVAIILPRLCRWDQLAC